MRHQTLLAGVVNLVCIVLQLVITYLFTNVIPMPDLLYDPTDERFSGVYPKDEPTYSMILTLWIAPLLWLLIIQTILLLWQPMKSFLILMGWFQTVVLTIFITGLLRYFLPYPRPFFTTICQPRFRREAYLFADDMCSRSFERRDVQSFPSGHASSVVSSWMFIVLVGLVGSRVFHHRRDSHMHALWKLSLYLLPALVVPVYVCSERVRSGNHTEFQVLFGAVLGVVVATMVFLCMDHRHVFTPKVRPGDVEALNA